jgi:hypothetical protein
LRITETGHLSNPDEGRNNLVAEQNRGKQHNKAIKKICIIVIRSKRYILYKSPDDGILQLAVIGGGP